MTDVLKYDYSQFDRPEILNVLFHPRREWEDTQFQDSSENLIISVEEDIIIGGRFYRSSDSAPTILFFHGNGEIAADYQDIGPMYSRMGINFIIVDYRGYGQSSGTPTVTAMIKDAHSIFSWVWKSLKEQHYNGPLIIMGRSLGSASALELAAHHTNSFSGLIIESGFSHLKPLLDLMGVDMKALGITEEEGSRNIDKIRTYDKPTLVIHAENDHLIALSEGKALFEACPAKKKRLLIIPGADHNTIFFNGLSEYMDAVKELAETTIRA